MAVACPSYRLCVSAMLAQPRAWGAWVGVILAFLGFVVSDSLAPKERSDLPSVVYVTLGVLLPTVWHPQMGRQRLSPGEECLMRTAAGIGFAALAFPIWVLAVRDVTWGAAVWLILLTLTGAWAWGAIAAMWSQEAFVPLVAAGIVALPLLNAAIWPQGAKLPVFLSLLGNLSAPRAYLSDPVYRWGHLVLVGAVGMVVWQFLPRGYGPVLGPSRMVSSDEMT